MAASDKDRLGDKLRDAERAREDQYFAERDRKLVEAARRKKEGEDAGAAAKVPAASMSCPKCGAALQVVELHGVAVDECTSCHGVWLDHGELELIAGRENEGWISRWLRREILPRK